MPPKTSKGDLSLPQVKPAPGYPRPITTAKTEQKTYQYAGIFVRFAALIVDALVLFVPVGILIGILSAIVGEEISHPGNNNVVALPVQILAVIVILFFVTKFGATPGKMFFGLKIIKEDGNIPNLKTAFMREVVGKAVSGLLLNLGYLWAIWDSKKQGIHDKIGKTYVIYVAPLVGFKKFLVYLFAILAILLPILAIILIIWVATALLPILSRGEFNPNQFDPSLFNPDQLNLDQPDPFRLD